MCDGGVDATKPTGVKPVGFARLSMRGGGIR